jgi:putative tricarboxylic transport membrane protein
MKTERTGNSMDRIAGGVVLLIGMAVIWQATRLHIGSFAAPGPGLFPLLLGLIIALLSIALIIFAEETNGDKGAFSWRSLKRVALVYGALLFYYAVLELVGFLIASFALLLFLSLVIGKQRIVGSLLRAVIMTGLSYLLFEVALKSQLPKGIIGGF